MEFKDKLRALRAERGLSQQALADAIFVSRSAVAKWENGLGLPGKSSRAALVEYFGVSDTYFDTETPEEIIVEKNKRIRRLNLGLVALLCTALILGGGLWWLAHPEENPILTQESVVAEIEGCVLVRENGRDLWYDLRFQYQRNNYDVIATGELLELFSRYQWTQGTASRGLDGISIQLYDGFAFLIYPDGSIVLSDAYARRHTENTRYFTAPAEFYEELLTYITENHQEIPDFGG